MLQPLAQATSSPMSTATAGRGRRGSVASGQTRRSPRRRGPRRWRESRMWTKTSARWTATATELTNHSLPELKLYRSSTGAAGDGDVLYRGDEASSQRREGARETSRRPLPNGADGGGSASNDVLELSSTPTSSEDDLESDDEQRGCGSRGDSERVRFDQVGWFNGHGDFATPQMD